MTKQRADRTKMVLALAAVYFIWGSTYLALRYALESFPPFTVNGIRFLIAGLVMYVWMRSRGSTAPTSRQWWDTGRVAAFMLVGGVGLVTTAQDVGVGSGLAATAVAMIPVWAALAAGLFGLWPRRLEWLGLAIGLAGVLVLVQEGDFQASLLGTLLVVVAPVLWAFGSIWATRLDLPAPGVATAATLLCGGSLLLFLGLLAGERIDAPPTGRAMVSLAYLIVFGSIIAYTAYIYLLRNSRPAMATSYAYVNPAVAVFLGMTLGAEVVTGPVFIALPTILIGVAIVTLAQRHRPSNEPEPEPTQ